MSSGVGDRASTWTSFSTFVVGFWGMKDFIFIASSFTRVEIDFDVDFIMRPHTYEKNKNVCTTMVGSSLIAGK
jgi:hypothetical protein